MPADVKDTVAFPGATTVLPSMWRRLMDSERPTVSGARVHTAAESLMCTREVQLFWNPAASVSDMDATESSNCPMIVSLTA
jgi:hypothetical protein